MDGRLHGPALYILKGPSARRLAVRAVSALAVNHPYEELVAYRLKLSEPHLENIPNRALLHDVGLI